MITSFEVLVEKKLIIFHFYDFFGVSFLSKLWQLALIFSLEPPGNSVRELAENIKFQKEYSS